MYWWREGGEEVGFAVARGGDSAAIEVKSGSKAGRSGVATFLHRRPGARRIVVGGTSNGACGVEEFLRDEVELFYG